MSTLSLTLIDVGWGDSLLLEWRSGQHERFALIDSNDSTFERSSLLFLKRHFSRKSLMKHKQLFDFVLLSHWHDDHGIGLSRLMKQFGTKYFWYPQSDKTGPLTKLLTEKKLKKYVKFHQSVDSSKKDVFFGDATISFLWPHHEQIDVDNENNNSVVLLVQHKDVKLVLPGDAEEDVWSSVLTALPDDIDVFKVPHHGSENGTFVGSDNTPWLDKCRNDPGRKATMAISAHGVRYGHPHDKVVDAFTSRGHPIRRTNEDYHVTLTSDGHKVTVRYSH